jgi:Pro-kumamolisin, activation domain/Bacterial Ig-like domain (group 1)
MGITHRSFLQVFRSAAYPLVMATIEVFLIVLLYVPEAQAGTAATRSSGHALPVHQKATPVPTTLSAQAETAMVRLPVHVLPAIQKAAIVPATPGEEAEPLTLTVVLKRDDQAGFDRYLHEVYDPHSPRFRHFLSQREITARFGPSKRGYEQVLTYLQRHGFSLVQGAANRLTLTVRGTRAEAERAFAVHIRDFQVGDQRFFANDADPAVPNDIAAHISGITGLSNLPLPRAAGVVDPFILALLRSFSAADLELLEASAAGNTITGGVSVGIVETAETFFFTLEEIQTAIAIARVALLDPGPATGSGQKIGLPAFSSFNSSDVADWLALVGLPASLISQVSQVHVNGGASLGSDEGDVLLGIDTILAIAPGAQIVVYDAPFTGPGTSFQTLFNAMINDGVTIISNSFSYCEDQTTLADVQSIDAILAAAAASGITVFNATGDSGSACQDGSPSTVAVPADSPHATSVGGTSLTAGPGLIYGAESWWDGSSDVPPSGQGGFGVSQFFTRPDYQNGLNASPMRSVPDVVAPADPLLGATVCEADAGGCPTGFASGGTSLATPIWAAFAALLNESAGRPFGFLNPLLYPLAGTNGFHSASSMGTDAAHVGLGSPNGNLLALALEGVAPGPPSASTSLVKTYSSNPHLPFPGAVLADGSTAASIVVLLRDADENTVAGKTVMLSAAGSHAVIIPASGVTTADNGAVAFTVTDSAVENVTFTATDETDGVTLDQTATVNFVGPPPSSAGISASPTMVNADGADFTTITVTLQDAQGHGIPGKQISLSQGGGHSQVTGPNPSVTDGNGQIMFTATDLVNETVTYTAVDVSDGNFAVPGTAVVNFENGSGTACGQNATPPVGLNGYTVTPFASGFPTGALFYSNVNYGGCSGVLGPAFLNGSAYVPDFLNGDLFKLGAAGGVVSNANKLTTIGPTLGWPVVGKDGRLYATRAGTGGNFNTGVVVELDPNSGAVIRTLASGLTCPNSLVVDPLSGDLFFDDECFGAGSDNASLFRIENPASANPTLGVYATLPHTPNGQIVFSPKGTIYVVSGYTQASPPVVQVSGTDGPNPPTVTTLAGVVSSYWVNIGDVGPDGEAQTLITLQPNGGDLQLTNIATATATGLASGIGGGIIGPDGCLYMPDQDILYKLTDSSGGCHFSPADVTPSIRLMPTMVSPNPAQGSSQSFTATLRNLSAPAGTPITLTVLGPNLQALLARTDANGQAAFTYSGTFTGTDAVVATANVGSQSLTSNVARVTWDAGPHTTFLTLNPSPKSGTTGMPVTVVASLTDVSSQPPAALDGQSVDFTLGSDTCSALTDANGLAGCQLTPQVAGLGTLTATFGGTADFVQSAASVGFDTVQPVQISDTTPPAITVSATPGMLWPPNGKMVEVTISGTIADSGSGVNGGTAAYAVTDEYGLVQPSGSITLDENGNYSFTIQLQASRLGTDKDGRQYTITVTAQDNAGNGGSASTVVVVSHDQR